MKIRKPVYEIEGVGAFKLQPTSPHFRKLASEIMTGNHLEMVKAFELNEESSVFDFEALAEQFDTYRVYFDLFCALTDGPHDKLDYQTFDQHYAEAVIRDFFLPATVTMLEQSGFIRTSDSTVAMEGASPSGD